MNLPVTCPVYTVREQRSIVNMSLFVTVLVKLCEIHSDIGQGQLSGLPSASACLSIKFTVPSRVLGMLAQVDGRDSYGFIAPESLLSGFQRVGTGKDSLIA